MNHSANLDQLENAQLLRHSVEEEPAYTFRHTLMQESVALWQHLHNTPMLAAALGGSLIDSFLQGRLDESVRAGEESYQLIQSIGNRYGLSLTGATLCYPYRELGQMHRAIELAEESIAIADEMKFYGPHWAALVELAAISDWLGDYARATEYARRALAGAIPNPPNHPVFPSSVLASIALHQGDQAQAAAWLAPFSADSRDVYFLHNFFGAVQVFSAPLELALAQNDANRAVAIADHAIALIRKRGMAIVLPSILHLYAKALSLLNRADEAYTLLIDARQQAEATQSRYRLLPILFTLIEMDAETLERGDADAANKAREQAHEIIESVAGHTPPGLRDSFLNLADVRKEMNE